MKKLHIILLISIMIFCICGITSSKLMAANAPVQTKTKQEAVKKDDPKKEEAQVTHTYTPAKALDIVNNPNAYLNKRVSIKAKFDKFSSLGLDYKPALRSSEKYITFLIRRNDAQNDIPLSELKNFMKREMAEKYIDLETDDVIEYSGLVFSNALGDAWLDVEEFKIISSKAKTSAK